MRTWVQGVLRGTNVEAQGRPTDRWDWLLSAVLVALVVLELVVDAPPSVLIEIASATAALAVLPFRRQIPVLAAVIGFGAQFVAELLAAAMDSGSGATIGHGIAGLFLIYALCRWPAPQQVAIGMATTMAFVLAGEFLDDEAWWQNLFWLTPWLVLGLFALAMRYRATLSHQHDQQIRLGERNELARELHDSVAHHVSAIAVQAQAAQFVADTDPAAAQQAMGTVVEIANTAIDEMRRLVGVLRSASDEARAVPAASLTGLADPTGSPKVTIVGETEIGELPVSVGAAVYRITQESVTNARRHSRNVTFVDIDLVTGPESVTLTVINDGTPTSRNRGGGYGLIGMNERVAALGGTIDTGPRPASGWRVVATLPLARPA